MTKRRTLLAALLATLAAGASVAGCGRSERDPSAANAAKEAAAPAPLARMAAKPGPVAATPVPLATSVASASDEAAAASDADQMEEDAAAVGLMTREDSPPPDGRSSEVP